MSYIYISLSRTPTFVHVWRLDLCWMWWTMLWLVRWVTVYAGDYWSLIVLFWMTIVDSALLSGDQCSMILWVTFIHKFTPQWNFYKCTNWFKMCNVKINYMYLHKIFLHMKFCPLEQKKIELFKDIDLCKLIGFHSKRKSCILVFIKIEASILYLRSLASI